jgi:hypothetical protein
MSAPEAQTWVTEVWSPAPDDGAMRVHSHMLEPEPLPEPDLEAEL